jgi:hypothetical protein
MADDRAQRVAPHISGAPLNDFQRHHPTSNPINPTCLTPPINPSEKGTVPFLKGLIVLQKVKHVPV